MDDILELASRLGKRIADDPRGQRMAVARDALNQSLPDRQLLSDFEQQQMKVQQLQIDGKPIEPEDKRRLLDLQSGVIASPVLKDLLKAQADYVELMAQVTMRIEHEALGAASET